MTGSHPTVAAVVLLTSMCLAPATAQSVYRCGNAYSTTPCPQGKAIDADDTRTAAQREEALRRAAGDKRRGDEMERAHLRREAEIRPALASALSLAPRPAATTAPVKKAAPKHRQAKPSKERRMAVAASAATRPKKN